MASVYLDRLIEREGMTPLGPNDEPPELADGIRVGTLNLHGSVSKDWQWADAIVWTDVVAWRAEDEHGNVVVAAEDDDDWGYE